MFKYCYFRTNILTLSDAISAEVGLSLFFLCEHLGQLPCDLLPAIVMVAPACSTSPIQHSQIQSAAKWSRSLCNYPKRWLSSKVICLLRMKCGLSVTREFSIEMISTKIRGNRFRFRFSPCSEARNCVATIVEKRAGWRGFRSCFLNKH